MNREELMELLKEYFPDSIIKIYENKIFIVADYIEAGEDLTDFLLCNSEKWSVSTDGDHVTMEIVLGGAFGHLFKTEPNSG